jgi:Domain of unknown function (DUF4434)
MPHCKINSESCIQLSLHIDYFDIESEMKNLVAKTIIGLLFTELLTGTVFMRPTAAWNQSHKAITTSLTHSAATASSLSPLNGAFIQFWGARPEKLWRQVMDAMKAAKMRTIIIQYLMNRILKRDAQDNIIYDNYNRPVMVETTFTYADAYTMPDGTRIIDPTAYILQYAEDNGMQVYIGLINDERFTVESQLDNFHRLNLHGQLSDNKAFISLIKDRYKTNPRTRREYTSFGGWYLPYEMWNKRYTTDQLNAFRRFFGAISHHCKVNSNNKPVITSPFFNPDTSIYLDAASFARMYKMFLRSDSENAGVDIVMLQDSVGARSIQEESIPTTAGPYYRELKAACNSINVKLWANVESFEVDTSIPIHPRIPTNYKRFEKQIGLAKEIFTNKKEEQIVTFDFFHYMNPYGHIHDVVNESRPADGPEYAKREKLLYCKYLRAFVPDVNPPEGVICEQ